MNLTVVIWSSFLSLILELLDLVLQDSGVQLPDREVVFIKELINGEKILSSHTAGYIFFYIYSLSCTIYHSYMHYTIVGYSDKGFNVQVNYFDAFIPDI